MNTSLILLLHNAVLGFFLSGRLLQDNSIVLLGTIGEGSSALYCLTDRELCCSTEAGANRGLWKFPSGSDVQGNGASIYSRKGFSSILLNKRSNTVRPTGVYRCLIPSKTRSTVSILHIGIYSSNAEGKFHSISP